MYIPGGVGICMNRLEILKLANTYNLCGEDDCARFFDYMRLAEEEVVVVVVTSLLKNNLPANALAVIFNFMIAICNCILYNMCVYL